MRPLALLAGLAIVAAADPASAYVRATNKTGKAVYWKSGCVFLTPSAGGSQDLGEASTLTEIQRSIDNWMRETADCSYLELRLEPVGTGKTTSNDAKNRITWLETTWGSGSGNDFVPYDMAAAALTTLRFVESETAVNNGEIVDADIELNGKDYTFATTGGSTQHPPTDVQNTLTHELGHLIGLDHTCDDGVRMPTPKDHLGNTVPRCSAPLSTAQTEATMYNFAGPGETKKRSPEADDIAGFCGIYPMAKDPGTCQPVQKKDPTRGCAAGGQGAAGALVLALLLLLFGRRQGEGIWCLAPRGAGRSVRRSNETT